MKLSFRFSSVVLILIILFHIYPNHHYSFCKHLIYLLSEPYLIYGYIRYYLLFLKNILNPKKSVASILNVKVNTLIFATPLKKEGLVRCLSGRKERFAKPSYGLNCTEGSNPSLTASLVIYIRGVA